MACLQVASMHRRAYQFPKECHVASGMLRTKRLLRSSDAKAECPQSMLERPENQDISPWTIE
jgi:hypothetical protein